MKTISRIAYSNDKRNRTRSILIMMAICLTTMLLVIISTVGNGVIHLQKSQAAGSYGSNYGLFVSADGSQLKEVNRRAEIDATGTMCTEGIIKGNENGGFVCMDETARKMLPYNKEYELKEGKYPGGTQEIAAGRAFFSEMGYDDVKVGDTVTLDYRAGMQSEYKPEEFVVSGILYDRDEYTIEASYVAFGSQEFYDEHVAENDRQYNIYFTLNDSANVSMNNIDSVIKQIAAACGIEEKNVIVNDLYLQWVLQPSYETIAVCGVLILAIVLFSVVVIYNIFQVGIANKIQEYGKIKALGATKKQMKQLIFREGIFLTIFSIPVGLLLGFLIAKCGFNWLVEQGNLVSTGTDSMGVQNQQVSLFSLPVMLLCIFVSFLTVALALRKPMKIVSRISPIEATRYATAKQRVSELEVLLCKIYEDNILGKLSDSRYATLDAQYEKEQTELTAEISALEKAVKSYEKHEKDADRFIALIDKYENFDKLTIAMLNEFIEKILVHERDRKGSIQTTQEVEIYFNFVGRFVPPAFGEVELTPEELEEIRKREERKDRLHQNCLKRKASGAQKRYEDKIKGRKKAEIEAKKAAIRAEDIAKGVFVPVSSLPQREPMKGVQSA